MARPARPPLSAGTIDDRARNRALLARQHLLERADLSAEAMIGHLVGMQAQGPRDPYVALWSRLSAFQQADLEELLLRRRVVRAPLMRTTLHLVLASDVRSLRPLMQPVLERTFRSSTPWSKQLAGLELGPVLEHGRVLVDDEPRTAKALAAGLSARWPAHDSTAMAQAVRYLVPMVQVPPRGLWTRSGQATWTSIEHWLGRGLERRPDAAQVVLRYLAAFGPATVADVRQWCGLTRLGELIDGLRSRLVVLRDASGREYLDLPDAPRPGADVPAPPRFLPEYDNLLLSHRDRRHVIPPAVAVRLTGFVGTFLIDGYVHGQWRIEASRERAHLVIDPFAPLTPADEETLWEEGRRLLRWFEPSAEERSVELGRAR